MNISTIISTLKSALMKYPLLISVSTASVILCIVFAFLNHNDNTDPTMTPPDPPVITTDAESQVQPTTPDNAATDAMGNAITTSPPPAAPAEFQTVENDYFNDALFIGNSRTVGLSMFGSMPEETTFYATVGMNIYDLLTSTAQIPPEEGPETAFTTLLTEQQFGKIYIMLGINDLGTGTSESFTEYYNGVVNQIHQMQPNAIIYVQSIIAITAERDAQGDAISNANINEKNAMLKELANNDYIYYLDVNEVLTDENGFLNADYTSDGVHLGGGSLSLWEDYLRSHAIVK